MMNTGNSLEIMLRKCIFIRGGHICRFNSLNWNKVFTFEERFIKTDSIMSCSKMFVCVHASFHLFNITLSAAAIFLMLQSRRKLYLDSISHISIEFLKKRGKFNSALMESDLGALIDFSVRG